MSKWKNEAQTYKLVSQSKDNAGEVIKTVNAVARQGMGRFMSTSRRLNYEEAFELGLKVQAGYSLESESAQASLWEGAEYVSGTPGKGAYQKPSR